MEAAVPAECVGGRCAPAGRSAPVGLESLVRDLRGEHVAGRRTQAVRSVSVGPESESLTRDL